MPAVQRKTCLANVNIPFSGRRNMGMDSPWTARLCRHLLVIVLANSPSSVYAWPGGIGGDQDNKVMLLFQDVLVTT